MARKSKKPETQQQEKSREGRLKTALKANLARRKARARARAAADKDKG